MIKNSQRAVLTLQNISVKRSANFELCIDNLSLQAGSVVCVVGSNGSGKTSLMESVVGLLMPRRGRITILDHQVRIDDALFKKNLGFIPDDDGWVINELSAREYFELLISVYLKLGASKQTMLENVRRLANKLDFTSFSHSMASLSHGNKKKVQIIAGLLHDPVLIVADELRNGLDPIAIRRAEDLLAQYAKEGTAILAATHDLWWAERFAQEIVMIRGGKVILRGTTDSIKQEAGSLESKFLQLYGRQHEK